MQVGVRLPGFSTSFNTGGKRAVIKLGWPFIWQILCQVDQDDAALHHRKVLILHPNALWICRGVSRRGITIWVLSG